MNCMRFENSQVFRMRCRRDGSGAGSEDSISALPRLREVMVMAVVIVLMLPDFRTNTPEEGVKERQGRVK